MIEIIVVKDVAKDYVDCITPTMEENLDVLYIRHK